MEQIQLTSSTRTGRGKGSARQLRRQGLIPAVLYGGELGNLALSVSMYDLYQIIGRGVGENALINLAIEEDGEIKNTAVIIKDFQIDPVMRTLLHADFLEVTMGQAIEVNIPLELTGASPGVKAGGVLEFITREIAVECLPSKIVDHIQVDTSSLEIGDTLTVSDISVDAESKILTDSEIVIATIGAPLTERAAEEKEEEEQAEPEVIQKGKKPEEE